jgi:hypothetical protein
MSTASTLLDDGAWTLAQSRRAMERAAWLQQQTRELLLAYRSHRVRVVAGSSDLGDADRDTIIRALASLPVKTFAGLSRGGVCKLCGETIKRDTVEYEVETDAVSLILDVECFNLFREAQEESTARRAS